MEEREEGDGGGGGERVRAVTYNVHSFCDGEFRHSFPRLVRQLRALRPDVLALNEALHPHRPPPAEQQQLLLGTDDTSDQVVQHFLRFMKRTTQQQRASACTDDDEGEDDDGEGKEDEAARQEERETYLLLLAKALGLPFWIHAPAGCGLCNVLFSRWPFKRVQAVPIPEGTYKGVWHELRSLIVATIVVPPAEAGGEGVEFDVLATHLEHKDEKVRLQQLIQCLSHVSPSRPHLLMGDLNAFTKQDYSYRHWLMIQGYYAKRHWVLREEKVIPYLLKAGYVDCWQEMRRLRQSYVAAPPPAPSPGQTERPDGSRPQPVPPATSSAATPTHKEEKGKVYLEQVDGRVSMLTEEERRMCTVWTSNPLLRIDFVLCSRGFTDRFALLDCHTVVECDASDHFPVLLDFGLKPRPTPRPK